MSKVKDNIITTGLSGKFGKQAVFRNWSGATIFAKSPVRNENTIATEEQIKWRLNFKQACIYAKKILNDPELKKAYKAKCKARQHAYNRAVQDFFTAPVVHEADTSEYTGETGSFIRIYTTDDFRVKQVKVSICDQNNAVVESGFAVQEPNSDWWKYTAIVQNLNPEDSKIIVSAFDLPGNETTKEMEI